MRYRAMDQDGDYRFGYGQGEFYVNSPEAVAQLVLTRLQLEKGEWFLDITDGTNWKTGVLGVRTSSTRDTIIRSRILGTTGVNSILFYSSNFNSNTRTFNVSVSIDTIYGIYPSPSKASVPTSANSTSGGKVSGKFILDSNTQSFLDFNTLG